MARTLLDGALRRWEAYTTTGPYGFSDDSRVVFRCTSDARERARALTVPGDMSDAEARVATATLPELLVMLDGAEPVA